VKTVKNKWKYLRDYFQKETKKVIKPKSGATGQDILKDSSWQYYNMMLFLKDLLHSGKSESSLHDSLISEPTESQDTSFDYNDEGNSIRTELPCPLSMPSTSSRPCSGSSASSEKNYHSGESRKRKILSDNTDQVILIEKRKLELLEKDMEREEDDDLLFLKSLLPDIKSLPRWRKRRLRLKFQELVINEVEEAEGQFTCISATASDVPEQSAFPVQTTESPIYSNIQITTPF
jgi:hypothetical protein